MAKAKILGKLRGPIASAHEKSRNGRLYNESFWDAKFGSELFQEGLNNKVFAGSLYHPDDDEEYSQIHLDDRAAVVLVDVKKTDNLDYIGTFEILPTKAGQCLRNLLDVGVKFGVSSRGLADYDAEVYDASMASTYDLVTFDLVAFPGLKSCRLSEVGAVAEGLRVKQVNKEKIMENLNKLTQDDAELASFVNKVIKAKEDFDSQLQVEDVMARLGIPDDYQEYANIVTIDENGQPHHYDKEHGDLIVTSPFGKKIVADAKPGDMFIVDEIEYRPRYNKYAAYGEWIKIN